MSIPASSASTCRKCRTTPISKILGKSHAGELPALVGVKGVAVAGAQMAARRRAAAPAQDELPAHELSIIFADRAGGCTETRIGSIGAAGPFPHAAEHLLEGAVSTCRRGLHGPGVIELLPAEGAARRRGRLPPELGRQPRAGPACKGVSLGKADMRDGRGGGERLPARDRGGRV